MMKILVLIKPGFLDKTKEVISAYATLGYSEIQRTTIILTKEQCKVLWGDIEQKEQQGLFPEGYFEEYCEYEMSDYVNCICLEKEGEISYQEVIDMKKQLRKKYNLHGIRDLLHTSDSTSNAEQEIQCIFG